MRLVLDSGAVTMIAERPQRAAAVIRRFRTRGAWPPHVPSAVLVECLRGDSRRDALTDRFLKSCAVDERLPVATARRAAHLRFVARTGSAVDALVVAASEPDGVVLTTDVDDLAALAAHSIGVRVEGV